MTGRPAYITAVAATVGVAALLTALWMFFPGLTCGNMAWLYVIVAGSVSLSLFTPCRGRAFALTLAGTTLLLGAGVILNAWYFTYANGGTPTDPILINFDSNRWWNDALHHIDASQGWAASRGMGHYGLILSVVLAVFGQTVGTALLWSMALIVTALIVTALLTFRLTGNRATAVCAAVCTACVCYWLSMGTLILKDPFVILALVTGAYGMVSRGPRFVAGILAAAVMLALARPGYIAMLAVGIPLVSMRKGNYALPAVMTAVCLTVWCIPQVMHTTNDVTKVIASDPTLQIFYNADNQMAFYNLIGDYSQLPYYKKILLLPFSAAVQFFIPFPWNFMRDVPFGITQAYAHFGYPWYAFGGVFVYYMFTRRKRLSTPVYRLSVWSVLCWLVPCYIVGGTVSRYGLSMVALMAPAVAVTLMAERRDRRFYVYMAVFAVVVAATLIVTHHLQMSAMP